MDYIKTLKNISINCMIDVKTLRIVLKYSRNQKYHALVGQKSGGRKVQKRNSHYFWNRPSYLEALHLLHDYILYIFKTKQVSK